MAFPPVLSVERQRGAAMADAVLHAWRARLHDSVRQLPSSLTTPSSDHPFVFFQLSESGSPSLIAALHAAAARLGVPSYLSCLDAAPCPSYFPPAPREAAPRYAVLGGHFHAADVRRWRGGGAAEGAARPLQCLVLVRRPVDRVAACWGGAIERTPAARLNASLGGCNNAAVRALSSAGKDARLAGALTAGRAWSAFALPALDDALGQLSRCVVGVLERCEESRRALRHLLPWLGAPLECGAAARLPPPPRLGEEAARIVGAQNAVDERVYALAVAQLEAQLRLIERTQGGGVEAARGEGTQGGGVEAARGEGTRGGGVEAARGEGTRGGGVEGARGEGTRGGGAEAARGESTEGGGVEVARGEGTRGGGVEAARGTRGGGAEAARGESTEGGGVEVARGEGTRGGGVEAARGEGTRGGGVEAARGEGTRGGGVEAALRTRGESGAGTVRCASARCEEVEALKAARASPHAPRPLRVALCVFGVVARSIASTWPSIDERVASPLRRQGWELTIYVLNMDVGSAPVDGVALRREDVRVVPAHVLETAQQAEVDALLDAKCAVWSCRFKYDAFAPEMSRNAMRQMYSELRVGQFLQKHASAFDVAVVVGSDLLFPLDVSVAHVQEAASEEGRRVVFTSGGNDAGGYTNAFYIGAPRVVSSILRRFDDFERHMHLQNDFEAVLKSAFVQLGVERRVTNTIFFKVRASSDSVPQRVVWQGGPQLPSLVNWTAAEVAQIRKEARKWKAQCYFPCRPNTLCFPELCFPEA
ncbi:hypothetical protein AB1Y20_022253 [Prymnesium parvum]|uniref:Uncharacterized protein n=1 Tax=Prymnesium parvum TaxID=97485 RepID=A0AB34JGJ1_PRYPA